MKFKLNPKLNKLLCVFLAVFVLLAFAGCSDTEKSDVRLKVVTVMFAQYDFARAICGNLANVSMISKPGGDVHGYEPSLKDIKKIAGADVFVYNGGESDEWVDGVLKSIDNPEITVVRLSDYVDLLCDNHDEEHYAHFHDNGHVHYDEHIHSSPKNALLMVRAVCDAVCRADTVNKPAYEANAADYAKQINQLDSELESICNQSRKKIIAVADRFPFAYMAHHYNLGYMSLFSGCSQENDANPSVMTDMIEAVKSNNLPAVFCTELSDQRMADIICNETGAEKLLLHSCEGISQSDFDAGITYVELMKNNIINLREAIL